MAAKLGAGVPLIGYRQNGATHLASATSGEASITRCNRLAYGKPYEGQPDQVTCKVCRRHL